MSTAIVIGAGIGGLSAALALRAQGWEVTVLERAPAFGDVGSAIVLAPNALNALAAIDPDALAPLAEDAPQPAAGGMRTTTGRWLIRQDLAAIRRATGQPLLPVGRPTLIGALAERLPTGSLRLGAEVERVDAATGTVTLRTGAALEADLVVAADGIHSRVRRTIFPDLPAPRFRGVSAWLLLIPEAEPGFAPGETWGRGRMFGSMPMGRGYYAFCELPTAEPRAFRGADIEHAEITAAFAEFPAPIPQLIAAADRSRIIRVDLHDLPKAPPAFHRGRVVLLGDAAHAMTPNLGQGAGQAIEDAAVLGRTAPDLAAYTRLRRPRTLMLQRGSRIMTRLATADGVTAAIRDAALSTLDALARPLIARQASAVFEWRAPERAAPVEQPERSAR